MASDGNAAIKISTPTPSGQGHISLPMIWGLVLFAGMSEGQGDGRECTGRATSWSGETKISVILFCRRTRCWHTNGIQIFKHKIIPNIESWQRVHILEDTWKEFISHFLVFSPAGKRFTSTFLCCAGQALTLLVPMLPGLTWEKG